MLGDKRPVMMEADRAIPGGVATLDETGKLTERQRPDYPIDDVPTDGSYNPVKSSGVFAVLQMKPNGQLLDNPDFTINQRGVSGTISTPGYFLDRWKLTSGSVTISSGGITLNGTIQQILETAPSGTLTASYLTNSGVQKASYDSASKTFSITASNTLIKAAKLELGSVQTLAHLDGSAWALNDPPPNKALELAKCQRYFKMFKNDNSSANVQIVTGRRGSTTSQAFLPFSLGSPMCPGGTPTIILGDISDIFLYDGTSAGVGITNLNIYSASNRLSVGPSNAVLRAYAEKTLDNIPYTLSLKPGGYFAFSMEL